MKDIKKMTYRELEQEVISNRCELRTASLEHKRELIRRNHALMVEMDARWNAAEQKRRGMK
ncbi:hypothetical protein PZH36_02195 [Ruminococcus bromii]|uniref:hypothetical protein n=1 Tax=Ruminococcus bromii TaxID=40518 RepID=UPI00292D947C|nr:hypothetical protein [Ruminococcus bromii]MDE8725944.1 hypothetical protein [Ruminococcus bromii]